VERWRRCTSTAVPGLAATWEGAGEGDAPRRASKVTEGRRAGVECCKEAADIGIKEDCDCDWNTEGCVWDKGSD